jgi:pimeloyl-ACP methyl ester carboxylesterase
LPQHELELFVYDTGPSDGASILLVHGLGDEADTWRHLIPELCPNHRVVAPDLPGFGRSSLPPRSLSPLFLVNVLLELMVRLEIPAALLLGSSLGGMLCQEVALDYPEKVNGLVLLDGTVVASGQSLNLALLLFIIPGVGEWMYNRLRRNARAAYDTLRPYYAAIDRLPQADQDFLFRRVNERVWSDKQRQAYFSVLRQLARWSPRQQKRLPERLGQCGVPTLAIWGEQDQIVSVRAAQWLTELQSSARLAVLPGAGHLPHQEQPRAVLSAIREDGRLLSP